MIIEFVAHGFFGLITAILEAIPDAPVETWDLGPAVGLAMALDAHLPVHEVMAAVAIVLVVDVIIWAFDTFDWLYEKVPFL